MRFLKRKLLTLFLTVSLFRLVYSYTVRYVILNRKIMFERVRNLLIKMFKTHWVMLIQWLIIIYICCRYL